MTTAIPNVTIGNISTTTSTEQGISDELRANLGIDPDVAVPIFIVFVVFYMIAYLAVVAFIVYKTDWKDPMDFGTRSRMLKLKNAQLSQKRKANLMTKEKAFNEPEQLFKGNKMRRSLDSRTESEMDRIRKSSDKSGLASFTDMEENRSGKSFSSAAQSSGVASRKYSALDGENQ